MSPTLKDMALLSMQLVSLTPVVEVTEADIEDDLILTVRHSKDSHIATLNYATKRLGNVEEAVAFILCLDDICGEDCSAEERLRTAAFYYREVDSRGLNDVLNRMVLLASQLASLRQTIRATKTGGASVVRAPASEQGGRFSIRNWSR